MVRTTGVTFPFASVDEEDVTKTLGGGVLRVGVGVGVGVSGGVGDEGVSGFVGAHELPQRVVTCDEVMGTVIVTVSTTVLVPPGISETVTIGTHVPLEAVQVGVSVMVVVGGGSVVTWEVVEVERLFVTTWSVLVKVGEEVQDDIQTRVQTAETTKGKVEEQALSSAVVCTK